MNALRKLIWPPASPTEVRNRILRGGPTSINDQTGSAFRKRARRARRAQRRWVER